jgi:hypothetical protein
MAATVLAANPARAIDPAFRLAEATGSVCQPVPGGGTPVYSDYGLISNQHSSATLAVDCPHPFIVDEDYGDELSVWLKVRGNGGTVFCTVFVEQITTWPGLPAYYLAGASTTAVGVTSLNVETPVFEGLSTGAMHTYCTLPPKHATNGAADVRSFMVLD